MRLSDKNQQFPSRPLYLQLVQSRGVSLPVADSVLTEIQPSLSLESLPVKQSLWRLCCKWRSHQPSEKTPAASNLPLLVLLVFITQVSLVSVFPSSRVLCCGCCCSRHHGVLLQQSSAGIQVIAKEPKSRKCWIGQRSLRLQVGFDPRLQVVFAQSPKSWFPCGHKLLVKLKNNSTIAAFKSQQDLEKLVPFRSSV